MPALTPLPRETVPDPAGPPLAPSVLLAVAGPLERELATRAMAALDDRADIGWVELVEHGGTSEGLDELARYTARLLLGRSHAEWVACGRPVPTVLVVADAEDAFKTRGGRSRQRRALLHAVGAQLPGEFQLDLQGARIGSRLVEVRTWGRLPFAFAHFTNQQLAAGLARLAASGYPAGRPALVAAVRAERRADDGPDIGRVTWPGRGVIAPADLAEPLWPVLEQRIRRSVCAARKGPPLMQMVLRAYDLAAAPDRWGERQPKGERPVRARQVREGVG